MFDSRLLLRSALVLSAAVAVAGATTAFLREDSLAGSVSLSEFCSSPSTDELAEPLVFGLVSYGTVEDRLALFAAAEYPAEIVDVADRVRDRTTKFLENQRRTDFEDYDPEDQGATWRWRSRCETTSRRSGTSSATSVD